MSFTLRRLNRRLKEHDSLLFAQETKLGRYDVYRKSQFNCNPPHFIFALTDSWLPTGRPVPWSADIVIDRIKAHDLWRDDSFVENYIKQEEAEAKSRDRARRNNMESFLYDFRSEFKKTFSDVNTANMEKIRKEY